MAFEITFFQGIAVVILTSLAIPVAFYIELARKLESRVADVIVKKALIVERDLIECLFKTVTLCTQKIFKLASEEVGEENISRIWQALPEQTLSLMRMSPEALRSSLDALAPLPKEAVEAMRLGDEEKDRLFHLSFLGFALNELVPETVSTEVDNLIKAIICGVIFGLLFPTLDFVLSQNLEQYLVLTLGLVSSFIIVTGYYYAKYGIMGIWSIRKLEKKVKKLNSDNSVDDIGETIEEIVK